MIIRTKHYQGLTVEGGPSFECIDIPGKTTPRIYYDYSIADLECGKDDRCNINALANAKRALHFLVDLLAKAFGIGNLSKNEHANFPPKLRT